MFVATQLYDEGLAAAQTAVGGQLTGALLGLITNAVSWGKGTVVADLVEPIYTGYARVAITWSAVFQAPDGTYRKASQLVVFQPADAAHPQNITGYFIVAVDGTTLLGGENYASPIPLPDSLHRIAESLDFIFTNVFQAEADLTN